MKKRLLVASTVAVTLAATATDISAQGGIMERDGAAAQEQDHGAQDRESDTGAQARESDTGAQDREQAREYGIGAQHGRIEAQGGDGAAQDGGRALPPASSAVP